MLDDSFAFTNVHFASELQRIENSGSLNGLLYSYLYQGAELLHARFRLPFLEIADIPRGGAIASLSSTTSSSDYIAADGSARTKIYHTLPEPTWQDFTEYEGKVVPLQIIEEMRLKEGATMDQWGVRGLEVKEETWAVLTTWYEKTHGGDGDDGGE